jgi:hypothetical protein
MSILDVLYYAAAAWYISYAVTKTHGPFGIFERIREIGGGRWHGRRGWELKSEPGHDVAAYFPSKNGLLDCIICLMVWAALILSLIGRNVVTDALAIAGVALWLHGFTGWRLNL